MFYKDVIVSPRTHYSRVTRPDDPINGRIQLFGKVVRGPAQSLGRRVIINITVDQAKAWIHSLENWLDEYPEIGNEAKEEEDELAF